MPTYEDWLQDLCSAYRTIFGQEAGLYGMLYQAAGSYASIFAITDLSVSGPFGSAREKLVPQRNKKYWIRFLTMEKGILETGWNFSIFRPSDIMWTVMPKERMIRK